MHCHPDGYNGHMHVDDIFVGMTMEDTFRQLSTYNALMNLAQAVYSRPSGCLSIASIVDLQA